MILGKTSIIDPVNRSKSIIASCAAHTMHRFTKSLKKNLNLHQEAQFFYCYCFSLLLNCTSLEMMQNYFQSVLVVSLSKSKTKEFEKEFMNLQTHISSRPDQANYKILIESYLTSDELNETLNKIYAEKKLDQTIGDKKQQKKLLRKLHLLLSILIICFQNITQMIISWS